MPAPFLRIAPNALPLLIASTALSISSAALAAPPAAAPSAPAPAPAPAAVAPAPAPAAPVPSAVAPAAAAVQPAVAPAAAAAQPAAEAAPASASAASTETAAPEAEAKGGDGVVVLEAGKGRVKIIVADDEDHVEVEEVVVEEDDHHHHDMRWMGLSLSTVFAPIPASGSVSEAKGRLNANKFRACVRPGGNKTCGYVKGFDFKVQIFEAGHNRDFPTVVGYFRTGFTAGRTGVDPGSNDFIPGQVTSMRYTSVPLFFGGNLYAFGDFPVRPYGGMGMGLDILRLDYRRNGEERLLDASARFGFELHGGIEGRISNFVSVHAEAMQLWSVRRKVSGVPDFSNTGLSVLAGVTVAIPTDMRGYRNHHHHRTVRRTKRTTQK